MIIRFFLPFRKTRIHFSFRALIAYSYLTSLSKHDILTNPMKEKMSGDPEQARKLNRSLILRQLSEGKNNSRISLAKSLKLSKMTLSVIMSDLLEEGFVEKVGEGTASQSGGRKPIFLALAKHKYVIGIDIGLGKTTIALANIRSEMISQQINPTSLNKSVNQIVNQLVSLYNYVLEKNNISKDQILGIGVSAAGLVDKKRGFIHFSPDFNWHEVPLKQLLETAIGKSVIVDNCTRVIALGEARYGGAKKAQNMFFIALGKGLGSAMILNGEIYNHNSEFGHIRVTRKPLLCDCGKEGCLEAVSSGLAIERRAYKIYGDEEGWISAKEVAAKAKSGDPQALEIFKDAGRYLGRAIAMVVNLFNPEKIIIGGGLSRASSILMDPLMESYETDVMRELKSTTSVELTTLGMESGIMGSVALALDAFLFSN